jgi:putative SOS response-associated peptidase YedK
MCGRFTQLMSWDELYELLDMHGSSSEPLPARYNIAPGTDILAAHPTNDSHAITPMHWGTQPEWAKSPLINAQAEKYTKAGRSFWSTFGRCVIPASGFYEWKAMPGPGAGRGQRAKQPMYISVREAPCLFAGLYRVDEQRRHSCVIMTTRPNELMADIHHRMPAILRLEDRDMWFDPTVDRTGLSDALEPFAADLMTAHPVGRAVNRATNDSPDLIRTLETGAQASLIL